MQPSRAFDRLSFVGQPNSAAASAVGKVLVGLETDSANAMGGKLLVALLGIAGDPDGTDDFTLGIANLQPAALRKDLVAACAHEIAHEDRFLLRAHSHEPGGAPHGKRGIGFAVSHLEAEHGAAVLFLERLHLAAGLDHDNGKRAAVERGAALEDGVKDRKS